MIDSYTLEGIPSDLLDSDIIEDRAFKVDLSRNSESNPVDVAIPERQKHSYAVQEELLRTIVLELKTLNKYMSLAQDIELTDNDIEE